MTNTHLPAAKLLMPHGLKGAIKAKVMLENPSLLVGHALPTSREGLVLTVTKVQAAPQNRHILNLAETQTREQAEALGGVMLMLPTALIPPAPEGEVYVMDLVGKPVCHADGAVVGKVSAVLENPAHPLMELDNGALIPAHFEYVTDLCAPTLVLTEMGEALLDI